MCFVAIVVVLCFCFKKKTAYDVRISDWSSDVCSSDLTSLKELLLYCYRVAGTVGLMMAHVMGLRDEAALKHAADLGIAMQPTNIARDRSEERRVGKEGVSTVSSRGAAIPKKKNASITALHHSLEQHQTSASQY